MARKLKVYRTAIGFHDAYVAAASQKAALDAWGTDKPLFARGAAEEVTDPELMAEPLGSPGKVLKRLRGTMAEQVAALPSDTRHDGGPAKNVRAPHPARPKPSRAKLDAAERAVDDAETRHRARIQELDEREKALRKERRALEAKQAHELDKLNSARDVEGEHYRAALDQWHE